MLALAKRLVQVVQKDDVDTLAAEIDAAKNEAQLARAEAERLATAAADELGDDEAEELLRGARAQDRAARRADARRKELQERLAAATWQKRSAAFVRHRREVEVAARRVIEATEAAAAANVAAIHARELAVRELGGTADTLFPRLFYNGLALPDLVAMWRHEAERQLDALARTELPKPTPPGAPRPVASDSRLPPIVGADAHRAVIRSVGFSAPPEKLRATVDTANRKVSLGVDDHQATPRRAPNLDDLTPLEPGQARVKALQGGWSPADDLPQCDRDQIVRMSREAAHRSVALGAPISIIEEAAE
jgi:hypothetical protein